MSPEEPFPPALPAVFQSPIGPAISYSNIRAVTSRAERTLDGLEKKVSKRLLGQLNDAGMVGAMVESKVRQQLADHIAPPEQLFSDTTDLIQNQIAGNLAPAVATLEDLSIAPEVLPGGSSQVTTAAPRGEGVTASRTPPPLITPPAAPSRATVTVGGRVSPGGAIAAGGTLLQQRLPPGNPLGCITQSQWDAAATAAEAAFKANPPPNPFTECRGEISLSKDCKYVIGKWYLPPETGIGVNVIYDAVGLADAVFAAMKAVSQVLGKPTGTSGGNPGCGPTGVVQPPVDCSTHPTDPSCPPPHDGGTDGTCPPPCIDVDVTCPPPVINVPPCPPLNLPTCVQIDLCDWDKFCKALKDCLVGAKEDCALDNDTAYTFKDCDGSYGEAQKNFLSGAGSTLFQAGNIDDLATAGMSLSTSISPEEYGFDKPY